MIITAFLEDIHQNYNEKLETSTVEGARAVRSVKRAEVLTQISPLHSPLPADLPSDSPLCPLCPCVPQTPNVQS